MNAFTVRPGSTWEFSDTLTDKDGNNITSLTDAWVSIYSDSTTEVLSMQLSSSDMNLASNVLTYAFQPVDTTAVEDGTYYMSLQIKQTDGSVTEFTPNRLKVTKRSPLYDDY